MKLNKHTLLFKNLEKCIGETLKVELKDTELNILVQAMASATIKGSNAIEFGKLLDKLQKAFEKEVAKQNG